MIATLKLLCCHVPVTTRVYGSVFQDNDTGAWWYYDETGVFAHGPYEDEMIARKGLWLYCRWLNSPQHPG